MLIENLMDEIRHILVNSGVRYEERSGKYGQMFSIDNQSVHLEITIDPKWIGYDLEVKQKISGKMVGVSEDTDNYPLTEKFEAGNRAVYEATKSLLLAYLDNKIYVGTYDKCPAIAIPDMHEDGVYSVKLFKRFFIKNTTLMANQLQQVTAMLPINDFYKQVHQS